MSTDMMLCKELAVVPAVKIQSRLHSFLADVACDIFGNYGDINSLKEQIIQKKLTDPLQWMLFGGDPTVVNATFESQPSTLNYCGKVFKSGEPAYFCKDCQTDPTCCLCMDCFEHSEHKTHKYRLFASGGGGCCDCGDLEAWTSGVYCGIHQPSVDNAEVVDPTEVLSSDLLERAQQFFSALVWYCVIVLTSPDQTLPPHLQVGKSAENLLSQDSYLLFLYNDEVHNYQQVMSTLTHNAGLSHTEAGSVVIMTDRKGRAVVKSGTKSVCEEIGVHIICDLSSPIIRTEKVHTVVASHQECAITLLAQLKDFSEKAAFRRIISQVFVDSTLHGAHNSALDRLFTADSSLWISARVSWHRLVLSSVFMDSVYKKQLAVILASNYGQLTKNFVADSHHYDVSANNMTVQVFTVPSLSRMLVLEHGLLSLILKTLQEMLAPSRDSKTGILQLNSSSYKHDRMFYIIYDLRYVLRNKPEQWSSDLRKQVLDAYDCLLVLLSWLQNADLVKRQRFQHMEREVAWEQCFNFSIAIQPAVLLFLEWCMSDEYVLKETIAATWRKHKEVGMFDIKLKKHKVENTSVQLVLFDVFKDSISVHQPLPRLIAALLSGAHKFGMNFSQLLNNPPSDQLLFLMEHASRCIVMGVQVMAGMWKRNGFSVVNQVINYQYHSSREMMYDKDILMLQCMAAMLEPDLFLFALLYKFRLEKFTRPESDPNKRGEPADDALRFFISEAEEFFFLLLTIYTERFTCGVGEGVSKQSALRREIIHRLYISPLSHSELVKYFRFNEDENAIDALLSEVASHKRRPGSGGKFVFELKPTFEEECHPFFYHYTRPDHSKAEEIRRRKVKMAGNCQITSCPPLKLPPFTAPYQGILKLIQCPSLHRLLQSVFKQAATPNSIIWSDKLLHETLYLCAVMLAEEDPNHPGSLTNAAISGSQSSFLAHLEALLSNHRAEEHRPLLIWCINYLQSAQRHVPDGEAMDVDSSQANIVQDHAAESSSMETNLEVKKLKAISIREKLMSQMLSMQQEFLIKHKEELDEVDFSKGRRLFDHSGKDLVRHECAVGVASLVNHTPSPLHVTCILCQEETPDFADQPKVFVQAACVQRTAVLCRESREKVTANDLLDYSQVDLIRSLAAIGQGVFTSGCGHHMHKECWLLFLENKKAEHSRAHFFPLPGQSVLWSEGEFLCPLCQCFGNTVLPLLPQVGQLSVSGQPAEPCRKVMMQEWTDMVTLALELATGDSVAGTSVDPTFLDKLEVIFPTYWRPAMMEETRELLLDPQEDSLFSQSVLMHTYGIDRDVSDQRVGLAQWRNCAYTIATLEYNARRLDKFILLADTLSSRQLNSVRSLVRLGSEAIVRPQLSELLKHFHYLTNTFLLNGPADPTLPCILEVDCFQMLINLHFSVSTLFLSVSNACGRCSALETDPTLLPLMGLTDAHLIKLTAAAHMLQFLLTCSTLAADEQQSISEDSGSEGVELSGGVELQQLWIKYRRYANLPCANPPNPNDLSVRVRQHMYSFLQCAALFFNCLSGVDLIYTSATMATYFDDLCKYLGLPSDLHWLFDRGPQNVLDDDDTVPIVVSSIAQQWCAHPKLAELMSTCEMLPLLKQPRQLVDLPLSYSVLVKTAANFTCDRRMADDTYVEDSQAAMLCLVCGQMLCTNSYCCRAEMFVRGQGEVCKLGGFSQHAQRCGAGIGMALWILESYVVLLDATNVHHVRGCTVNPPYFDEYGEADPGLRRGNPMHFSQEAYKELQQLWYQHHILERVHKEMESNRGLMRIQWNYM